MCEKFMLGTDTTELSFKDVNKVAVGRKGVVEGGGRAIRGKWEQGK